VDKLNKIELFGIRSMLLVLLTMGFMSIVVQAHAIGPTEHQEPDSMWVEPSSVTYSLDNATIGTKFNVTVWLNIASANIFGYQFGLMYNRTQLRGARGGFTAGSTSKFMELHDTQASGPIIDTSFLGNGSVVVFESCKGDDKITVPNENSTAWVEFEIMLLPEAGKTITSTFDITSTYPDRTWAQDENLNKVALTTYDGTYTVVPEFWLILPIFMSLTLFAIVFRKRILRKTKPQ
jgi:hypothetical protein